MIINRFCAESETILSVVSILTLHSRSSLTRPHLLEIPCRCNRADWFVKVSRTLLSHYAAKGGRIPFVGCAQGPQSPDFGRFCEPGEVYR